MFPLLSFVVLLFLSSNEVITAQNSATTAFSPFKIEKPDYEKSPFTGMTRNHWKDAALYLLQGAFSHVHSMDDPMYFKKMGNVLYPRNERQIPTAKLEGLCRTLFMATPLLKENPNLEINHIKVADYYRHQLVLLSDSSSPTYIKHRGQKDGPLQNLVEFGALGMCMFIIPEVLWEPLTVSQKENLKSLMISYGDGPTYESNWNFFNTFILSFFKSRGYQVNEALLEKYVSRLLAHYRGDGWYNDNPAFDYYSMWAFQLYGQIWSHYFGEQYYPEYAKQFEANFKDMFKSYPYMFERDGHMIMWGRSILYRFASIGPLAFSGLVADSELNYGWYRRIASGALLQFLQRPDFLAEGVPVPGFYGPFDPCVQGYSCRGSVYWTAKAFLGLLLPESNPYWNATENEGVWETMEKDRVYNRFQQGPQILITNYPNSGASEIRAWAHVHLVSTNSDRAGENYNRLAYNTAFPWMKDGNNGEVAMDYVVKNGNEQWEPLRLYTFKKYADGVFYRDAVLQTNKKIQFRLADITIPNGILRVDKVISPLNTEIRLGHYALPEKENPIQEKKVKVNGGKYAYIISNGEYQQAMISLAGWDKLDFVHAVGLHPESNKCTVINSDSKLSAGETIFVTLQLWKKGKLHFKKRELMPIEKIDIIEKGRIVKIKFKDNTEKVVNFDI